uniref:RecF/RecN/SMC N-terminal domain-containing protein n=1 Tax=Timema cristinae TaxID=61476 RepID=A0A7R9CE22_TIMCR|nr:unnamed protein product [Timema cristinae]
MNVRASGFQDLVYKNGQAGVTKASVTIIFDNTDKEHCPIGYEQHKEITITRQVVIGGKNKYMINGTNCLNKRVQDLFCSVQLNVNNPHFLIMQGRITKVLNMKPPEILSMIEEAAGTSMYEVKRMSTRSTIERKDIKMKELSSILDPVENLRFGFDNFRQNQFIIDHCLQVVKEEIAPKLEKMKTERQQVMEYNKIQRELDLLTRLYVAWRYVSAEETAEKAKIQVQQVHDKIAETRQKIVDGATEVEELNKLVQELQSKVDSVIVTSTPNTPTGSRTQALGQCSTTTGRTTPQEPALVNYYWDETCLDQGTGQLSDDIMTTPRFQMMPSHHEDSGSDNPENKQGPPKEVPRRLSETKTTKPRRAPDTRNQDVALNASPRDIGSRKRRRTLLKKSKITGTSYKYTPASPREDAAHIHTVGDDRSQQV